MTLTLKKIRTKLNQIQKVEIKFRQTTHV